MSTVTDSAHGGSRDRVSGAKSPRSPERDYFPALVDPKRVYLDSAATTLVPSPVIDAVLSVYREGLGGVHRGVHALAARATERFELARQSIARHVGASEFHDVVLGRGTTEALNVLARGLSESLREGDEVLTSELDHHANIVSWQLATARVGAVVRVVPVDAHGVLSVEAVHEHLGPRTRVLALPHVSNVTGAILDVKSITGAARARGAIVIIDGAQAVRHLPVNVTELGCHAYVFGAHKTYGPNGVGVLVAERSLLEALPPLHGGGHMVTNVASHTSTLAPSPARHEAGSPNLEGVLGLEAALEYLHGARLRGAFERERVVARAVRSRLSSMGFLRLLGCAEPSVGIVSFVTIGMHAHDVAAFLDSEGIAVRAGRMCAHPLFERLGQSHAIRVSLSAHSDTDDLDTLEEALRGAQELFA